MSNKMTCPGCNAHLSSVWEAYEDERPCPNCGLSWAAANEILAVQRGRADAELQAKYIEVVKRAEKAEGQVQKLERRLFNIKQAVEEPDEDWRL